MGLSKLHGCVASYRTSWNSTVVPVPSAYFFFDGTRRDARTCQICALARLRWSPDLECVNWWVCGCGIDHWLTMHLAPHTCAFEAYTLHHNTLTRACRPFQDPHLVEHSLCFRLSDDQPITRSRQGFRLDEVICALHYNISLLWKTSAFSTALSPQTTFAKH